MNIFKSRISYFISFNKNLPLYNKFGKFYGHIQLHKPIENNYEFERFTFALIFLLIETYKNTNFISSTIFFKQQQ